jgi:hypothetical protein
VGSTGRQPVAPGWARQNSCILMVSGGEEADRLGHQLSDQGNACLMTYRRVEDLVLNAPAGRVALVILVAEDDPAGTRRTLRWLGHRWPGCPIMVVSTDGGLEHELAARQGGAFYLASGEAEQQLPDMVSHVLRLQAADKTGRSRPN